MSMESEKVQTGTYEQVAQLVVGCAAIARYGEVKFPSWQKTTWDDYYLSLEVVWTRLKTRKLYPVYFQVCNDSYLCDYLSAFYSFFLVEDGLMRPQGSLLKKMNAMFPSLLHLAYP